MSAIVVCIRNELDKITRRKKYRFILIITLLITVCGAFIGAIPNSVISISAHNYPYTLLSLCCYFFTPFTAFMLASDLISGECEKNELKLLLTHNVNRTEILFGKLAAIAVYEFILTAVNVITALICSLMLCGFTSVNIFIALMSVIITIIPMTAFVSFAGIISVFCKNGVSAFGMGFAVYGGFMLLGLIFSRMSDSIFTSYLTLYKMIIGQSIPMFRLLLGIGVLLGFSLLFLSGASMKFEKKNSDFTSVLQTYDSNMYVIDL